VRSAGLFDCTLLPRFIHYSSIKGQVGNIPQDIGDLTELRSIKIDACFISGSLPDSMAMLSNLYKIEIWESFDDGITFPKVIREMNSLRFLEFWGNDMAGGIPEWVCELLIWLETLWYHLLFTNPFV
jgi:hypothetical protein